MPNLNPKPEGFREGSRQVSSRALNQMREAVPRQVRGGDNSQVSSYGDRILIQSGDADVSTPGVGNYLVQFQVLQEFDDYLLCVYFAQPSGDLTLRPQVYTSNVGTGQIQLAYVAKPYWLQRTPWDGQVLSYNGLALKAAYTGLGLRTLSDALGHSATQAVSPAYIPGEVIVAVKASSGYQTPDGNDVVWQDINAAGRVWANLSSTGVNGVADSLAVGGGGSFTPAYAQVHIASGSTHVDTGSATSYFQVEFDTLDYLQGDVVWDLTNPNYLTVVDDGLYLVGGEAIVIQAGYPSGSPVLATVATGTILDTLFFRNSAYLDPSGVMPTGASVAGDVMILGGNGFSLQLAPGIEGDISVSAKLWVRRVA